MNWFAIARAIRYEALYQCSGWPRPPEGRRGFARIRGFQQPR